MNRYKAELLEEIERLKTENLYLRNKKINHKSTFNDDRAQYESLLNNLPVGVFKSTLDGKLIFSNKKMVEMLGFSSKEELKSHPVSDIYKDKTKRDELIRVLKKTGELQFHEIQLIKKDKSFLRVSITEKLVEDKGGQFLYIEGIIEDITEKKNNEKKINKLAKLVEQASVSIVLTDLYGNIEYVNPFFEELTGYNQNEAMEMNPRILKSPNAKYSKEYYQHMWKTINQGNVWKGKFTNRKKNGNDYIEDATIFPIKDSDGELLGFGAVKKDITWNVEIENVLEESFKEMEILKDKAESASKLKTIFFANISHDIRSPLTGLIGYADLLTKYDLGEKQQKYVGKIIKSGNILLNLINDLLDMTKIEAGHFSISMETYFLNNLLENIATIFNHQFEKRELGFYIELDSEVPERIYGDMLRTQQVIFNLISNSLKFTLKGKVTLSIKYDRDSDIIKFLVIDTGVGIPKDIQDKVFGSFYSVRSTKKFDELSTGLGLSICKNITEMIGGKISLSSQPGKGSTFIVELPANSGSIGENDPSKLSKKKLKENNIKLETKKILIVDDNPVNIELLKDNLIIKGFSKIEDALNGNDAIRIANEFNPDIILMDKRMPGKDGIETTKDLRANGLKTPIIMLSADSSEENIEELKALYIDDYISKPIDFEDLYIVILKLLKASMSDANKNAKKIIINEGIKTNKYIIDKSVSEKIKIIFLNDLESKLKIIEKFIDSNGRDVDLQSIIIIAHTYKGNSEYFGLKCLESISIDLESKLPDISENNRINLLKEMADIIKNIIKYNSIISS